MASPPTLSLEAYLWTALGIAGALTFYGRFYVQWIASEIKKRSVMPVAFWYMSSCGSVMLLAYAVWSRSPLGALGQNVNIVIYVRNLVHIGREKGTLNERWNVAIHGAVILVGLSALAFVAHTWYREYEINQGSPATVARENWMWLSVGLAGQGLFALRFLVQWIATERKQKSVVPPVFWKISLAAALLQCAAFTQRGEWIFAVGMGATLLIYGRNMWFIWKSPGDTETLATNG